VQEVFFCPDLLDPEDVHATVPQNGWHYRPVIMASLLWAPHRCQVL